jgi:hypothetical protein
MRTRVANDSNDGGIALVEAESLADRIAPGEPADWPAIR